MKKKSRKTKVRAPAKPSKRKLLTTLRKDASAFLTSEEGKIVKKDIVKMALAMGLTAASIGTAEAQHSNVGHGDVAHFDGMEQTLHNDGATSGHNSGHSSAAHSDIAAHSDHSNHSNGGWC